VSNNAPSCFKKSLYSTLKIRSDSFLSWVRLQLRKTRQAVFFVYFNRPDMNLEEIFDPEFSFHYAELKSKEIDQALSIYSYPLSNLTNLNGSKESDKTTDSLILNSDGRTKIEIVEQYEQVRNWLQDYAFTLAKQIQKEQARLEEKKVTYVKNDKQLSVQKILPGVLFLRVGPAAAKQKNKIEKSSLWENFFVDVLNNNLKKIDCSVKAEVVTALDNKNPSLDEKYLKSLQGGFIPVLSLNLWEDSVGSVGIDQICSSNGFPFLEWGVLLGPLDSIDEVSLNQVLGRFFRDGKLTNFYYSSWEQSRRNAEFSKKANESLRNAEKFKALQNFLFINFVKSDKTEAEVKLDLKIESLLMKLSTKRINEKDDEKERIDRENSEKLKEMEKEQEEFFKNRKLVCSSSCCSCNKEARYELIPCQHFWCKECYDDHKPAKNNKCIICKIDDPDYILERVKDLKEDSTEIESEITVPKTFNSHYLDEKRKVDGSSTSAIKSNNDDIKINSVINTPRTSSPKLGGVTQSKKPVLRSDSFSLDDNLMNDIMQGPSPKRNKAKP
jgi:hypothetical protein